jgi:hypothetical protein
MPRADSLLHGRVIFLVGARRSGTNWLERILTAHPEVVAVPTETYLFSHGIRPLADCFQHANPGAPSIGRSYIPRDAFLDGVRDLVDHVFAEAIERGGGHARYVVERTPWHASHLRLIADVYADAHVINIVRDGRAVARSLLSMPWGPSDMAEAAAEWQKAVDDAQEGRELFGDAFLEIGYEALFADPRAHVAEIFRFLELELTDETWARILTEAGSQFNVDPGSPGLSTDKWRDELSPEELRAFEEVAGARLASLGYATGGAGARADGRAGPARGRGLKQLRHPRQALDAYLRRWSNRRLHEHQVKHREIVSAFERHVANGDPAAAQRALAPKLRARIDGPDGVSEARGEAAHELLLAALTADGTNGARVISGGMHVTAYGITTVATYEQPGAQRWARVVVYEAMGGLVRGVTLYRFALAPA